MGNYFVYILSNAKNTTLYVGVTNNLERRMYEHKNGLLQGFTKKYNIHKLLYFETTPNVISAIEREKQIKGMTRIKKENLILQQNPNWIDLCAGLKI